MDSKNSRWLQFNQKQLFELTVNFRKKKTIKTLKYIETYKIKMCVENENKKKEVVTFQKTNKSIFFHLSASILTT